MKGGGDKSLRSVSGRSLKGNVTRRPSLIGVSALFKQVLDVADAVADKDCIVLLEGESGTGKELVARRIHARSSRTSGPFIPVNCPGTTKTLFESQFYGHVKGAFTGATSNTLGVVRSAEGGTLLLDEISELSLYLQPKLLRLLQEREVTPVGASQPLAVDTRFIAATNRSLARAVAHGTFRTDLYHRLNIVRVEIPPLRSRPEDIDPLLDYYLDYYAGKYNMPRRQLSIRLQDQLREYSWLGNVRELCGYVERLYATGLLPMPPGESAWHDGYVTHAPKSTNIPSGGTPKKNQASMGCTLADAEATAIQRALEATDHNRTAAAKILDIHRSTLIRKISTLRLERSS